ncbi:MAG: hypothetical protein ACI9FN_000463 [Saprospiraceae bacterium]|jgi:hypothetical protein
MSKYSVGLTRASLYQIQNYLTFHWIEIPKISVNRRIKRDKIPCLWLTPVSDCI